MKVLNVLKSCHNKSWVCFVLHLHEHFIHRDLQWSWSILINHVFSSTFYIDYSYFILAQWYLCYPLSAYNYLLSVAGASRLVSYKCYVGNDQSDCRDHSRKCQGWFHINVKLVTISLIVVITPENVKGSLWPPVSVWSLQNKRIRTKRIRSKNNALHILRYVSL